MRIAEYKQIETKLVETKVMVDDYDDNGNYIGQHEQVTMKEEPVMGVVYRDMTAQEESEHMSKTSGIADDQTVQDRVTAVQECNKLQDLTIDDIVLLMADIIGGA